MRSAVAAVLSLTACGEGSFSAAPLATADDAAAALAPSDSPAFFDCLRMSSHAVVSAHRGPRPGVFRRDLRFAEALEAGAHNLDADNVTAAHRAADAVDGEEGMRR